MKVVLDTNIILASISRTSPYKAIFENLKKRTFDIFITTEILLEYEEKLSQIFSKTTADFFLEAIKNRSNVHEITVYYNWQLIYPDLDDNKFVDCAVAGGVDYLVTNDRDYLPLKNIPFPKLKILKIEEFMELLKEEKSN